MKYFGQHLYTVSEFVTIPKVITNHVDVETAGIPLIAPRELLKDPDTATGTKPVLNNCMPESIESVILNPDRFHSSPRVTTTLYLISSPIVGSQDVGLTMLFATKGARLNVVNADQVDT
jgi:hypothetical protein